jgi:hypothetical protein
VGSVQKSLLPLWLSALAEVDKSVTLSGDNTAVDEQIGPGEGGVGTGQKIGRGRDVISGTLPARR